MEEFIQGFKDEALELIENLDALLLEIEETKPLASVIQEIFRIMHTIKGSGAMFGFVNTERITHGLEDVYDLIRDGELSLSSELIALTLKTSDIIKHLLVNDDAIDKSIEADFVSVIEAVKNIAPQIVLNESEMLEPSFDQSAQSKDNSKHKLFYIRFKPDNDVLKRGLVVPNLFEELEEIGKVSGLPFLEDIPDPKDFDPSEFYMAWDLFVSTDQSIEDVEDCFMFYMSHEFKIIELANDELNTNQEFLSENIALNKGTHTLEELQQKLNRMVGSSDETVASDGDEEIRKAIEEPIALVKKEKEKGIDSIKVDALKLDELVNLVSELVTLNSRLELFAGEFDDDDFKKTVKAVSKLSKRFRDNALEMRLIPVKVLELKMQRLIRDLSKTLNKEVQFIVEGTKTELDKNIITRLEGPLMHILRNSLDHGLESTEERINVGKPAKGVIRFIAFYSGSNVFIQIQDDGKGINPDKIVEKAIAKGLINKDDKVAKHEVFDLLFKPGFSTAETVTNVSGRGVGLDVVRNEIMSMRGEIDIESEVGLGTSFTIKLPLTLSIIDTLMVLVNNTKVLIPRENIVHTQMEVTQGFYNDKVEFKGALVPVISLPDEFYLGNSPAAKAYYIMVNQNEKNYALIVDKIYGEHQAVVKPLGYYNANHPFFSSASIMGDGSLALILDVAKLINGKKSKSKLGKYNLK